MTAPIRALFACTLLLATVPSLPAQQANGPPPSGVQDPSGFEGGRREGELAVRGIGSGRWFATGLAGGLVLGPIGTGAAMAWAGRGVTAPHDHPVLHGADPSFAAGFREGFRDRLVRNRRTAALIGGVAGTTVLTVVLIHRMGGSSGGGSGSPPTGPPLGI